MPIMPPDDMGGIRIYLNDISVLRNAKCIWIYWIVEERLRNLMLHHLLEYLGQGSLLR